MQDIENSILQRFANRAMRHAIHAITEVAGLCATDMELPYDQMLKDSIAVMALSDPDLHLVRRITIPAIENYVNHFGGMKKFMKTTTFKKFLAGRGDLEDYMHPKLVHYITEHVHPSLMQGAKQFEHCLSRLEKVLDVLITQTGIHINTEYILLQDICTMIENNLAMIASLARASRSYAIGLRNSDLEVQWTIFFCTIAAEQSKKIAHDVMLKENEMVRITPRLTAGAKDMLQHNGYCLESPVERNW